MENTTLRQPNERARHLSIYQIVTFWNNAKNSLFLIYKRKIFKSLMNGNITT